MDCFLHTNRSQITRLILIYSSMHACRPRQVCKMLINAGMLRG